MTNSDQPSCAKTSPRDFSCWDQDEGPRPPLSSSPPQEQHPRSLTVHRGEFRKQTPLLQLSGELLNPKFLPPPPGAAGGHGTGHSLPCLSRFRSWDAHEGDGSSANHCKEWHIRMSTPRYWICVTLLLECFLQTPFGWCCWFTGSGDSTLKARCLQCSRYVQEKCVPQARCVLSAPPPLHPWL